MGEKRKRISFDEQISINKSDIPFASLSGVPHIEFFGNTRMSFEGKYSITEYSENMLKVRLGKQKMLTVTGSSIMLSNVESGAFMLTGRFSSVEFE